MDALAIRHPISHECEEGQLFTSTPLSQTQGWEWRLWEPGAPVNPLSSFIKSICLPVTV